MKKLNVQTMAQYEKEFEFNKLAERMNARFTIPLKARYCFEGVAGIYIESEEHENILVSFHYTHENEYCLAVEEIEVENSFTEIGTFETVPEFELLLYVIEQIFLNN